MPAKTINPGYPAFGATKSCRACGQPRTAMTLKYSPGYTDNSGVDAEKRVFPESMQIVCTCGYVYPEKTFS